MAQFCFTGPRQKSITIFSGVAKDRQRWKLTGLAIKSNIEITPELLFCPEGSSSDSSVLSMATPILPWVAVALPARNAASPRTALTQLYEPYRYEVAHSMRPGSVSMVGWDKTQSIGPGLSTSLHDGPHDKVICNFLQLNKATRRRHLAPCMKSMSIDAEITTKFLCHLCLEISDIICIRAQTAIEAIRTIHSFRQCLDAGESKPTAQFIIFIENPSSCIESEELYIKEQLRVAASSEDLTECISRVAERVTVRAYHPKMTKESVVIAAIEDFITSARRRRGHEGHLWTLGQLMYLVSRYFTSYSPFLFDHRRPPSLLSQWPGATWYPMAFRRQFWPGSDVLKHNGLTEWLRATKDDSGLEDFLPSIFARMFLEDGGILPHELHCSELFASIYEPLCRDAWIKAAKGQLRKSFLDAVASKMRHSDSLLQEEAILGLQRIKATSLCSMCPWDMQPEVFFDCGHGICARDAWHYSQIRLYESDHSTLAQFKACPVCSKPSSLRVRLRPLQAGYRLGAFDGGGTYAINELILLQYIIQPMPAGLEAHHYFDHVTATSAGSLIACPVFIMQWPLSYCIQLFQSTAEVIFAKKSGRIEWLWKWKRLYSLVRYGAKHDIGNFCDVLKYICGGRLMRNTTGTEKERVHVAITATTFDGKLCLFRSYGNVLRQSDDGGYISQAFPDLPLWKAVATSCAVPPMYAPVSETGNSPPNDVLDGFILANCPVGAAKKELNELSMLEGRQQHDFIVSFGAGKYNYAEQKESRSRWRWVKCIIPEWIPRLTCCLSGAVNADHMYERISDTVEASERETKLHRMQPCLTGKPSAQDDPTALKDHIRNTKRYMKDPRNKEKIDRTRLAMLAACFYVKLLSPPLFDPEIGQHKARLAILSRWPEDKRICSSLCENLKKASFQVGTMRYNYESPLYCEIQVPCQDERIEISFTLEGKTYHPVSGFPQSITELIYLQPPPNRKRRGSFLEGNGGKRRCGNEDPAL